MGIAVALSASALSAVRAAEAPEIPDSLLVEVVTAPGYLWMGGCGELGRAMPAASDDKGPPADDAGHLSHHPAATTEAPEALLLPGGLERVLGELNRLLVPAGDA